MAMPSFGGIDVSKGRLDVMVLPEEQCSSVSNDAGGRAELVDQLRGSSNVVGAGERGRTLIASDTRIVAPAIQSSTRSAEQSRYRCSQTRCLPQENRASEHVARC